MTNKELVVSERTEAAKRNVILKKARNKRKQVWVGLTDGCFFDNLEITTSIIASRFCPAVHGQRVFCCLEIRMGQRSHWRTETSIFRGSGLQPGELNHPEITDEAFNWPLHLTREAEDEADIVEISFGGKAFVPLRRSGEEDLEEDDC